MFPATLNEISAPSFCGWENLSLLQYPSTTDHASIASGIFSIYATESISRCHCDGTLSNIWASLFWRLPCVDMFLPHPNFKKNSLVRLWLELFWPAANTILILQNFHCFFPYSALLGWFFHLIHSYSGYSRVLLVGFSNSLLLLIHEIYCCRVVRWLLFDNFFGNVCKLTRAIFGWKE